MKVEQLMNKDIKTCSPNDTLEVAARLMWEGDCGAVPVVDGEGRGLAMITDRDICMAGLTQGLQYWQIPVSSAASKTLFSVKPTDSVRDAEDLMKARQVRRLAVSDDGGRIVGVISLSDLARHAGRRIDDLSTDDVFQTLAAVCRPPRPETSAQNGG